MYYTRACIFFPLVSSALDTLNAVRMLAIAEKRDFRQDWADRDKPSVKAEHETQNCDGKFRGDSARGMITS